MSTVYNCYLIYDFDKNLHTVIGSFIDWPTSNLFLVRSFFGLPLLRVICLFSEVELSGRS